MDDHFLNWINHSDLIPHIPPPSELGFMVRFGWPCRQVPLGSELQRHFYWSRDPGGVILWWPDCQQQMWHHSGCLGCGKNIIPVDMGMVHSHRLRWHAETIAHFKLHEMCPRILLTRYLCYLQWEPADWIIAYLPGKPIYNIDVLVC